MLRSLNLFWGGRDIKRYRQPESDKFLIFTKRGIDIENYPAVYNHLMTYKKSLSKRAGKIKWYELQASPSSSKNFEDVKIMYPDISKNVNFIIDYSGHYCLNTVYNLGSVSLGLLGYLNSSLFEFYYKNISNSIRGGYMRFFTDYVAQCPIPKNLEVLGDKVYKILELKKNGSDTSSLEKEIDRLVYELYGLNEEEIKIVEGRV